MEVSITNECIVLIPYYRNELTEMETYSLQKGLSVFSENPVCFFSPEGLEISKDYAHVTSYRFEKKYFSSLQGYNQLLLSADFYHEFLSYKYILIYQLDALVFSNQLSYWCSLNYDYYGAPWVNKTWRWKYFNLFGLISRKVGNGGFCLRKTATFYRMAKKARRITKHIKFGEDIFWCNYGFIFNRRFRVIDSTLAMKFSFEQEPRYLFNQNGYQLPFGCHAFEKNDLTFWKEMLEDLPGRDRVLNN